MSCETPRKNGMIGASVPVRDAAQKVTGQIRYVDDMKLPHMLHAKLLTSPYAHAFIRSIHTERAEALPGVLAVVCWKNAPKNRYNGNGEDKDIKGTELVFDRELRYVGDKVAAVAAETEKIAEEALSLIEVEYEELPFVLDAAEALLDGAPAVQEGGNLIMPSGAEGGNVDQALSEADCCISGTFFMPAVNHCSIEPHVSLAEFDASGKLTVWTPTQDAFGQRINLQRIFGLPMSKIRVISPVMGGGFGGKIDLVTEPITALLAMKTGRPVKLCFTRKEEFSQARTRHAARVRLKLGLKNDGSITAADEEMLFNAGAQTSATMSVCWAGTGKFFKLLSTRNMRVKGLPVYTNRPVASAMRGFGSPQQFFPLACLINEAANKLHMDPALFFLKNLAAPFETACNDGESFGNFRIRDCVKKGMELMHWDEARAEMEASQKTGQNLLIGVGLGCGSHGTSMFPFQPDITGITIKMNEDGSVVFTTGTSDMGNGSVTTQCMLISEVLGLPLDQIAYIKTDTDAAMSDLGAYASRGTYTSGHAAVKAAELIRDKAAKIAAELIKKQDAAKEQESAQANSNAHNHANAGENADAQNAANDKSDVKSAAAMSMNQTPYEMERRFRKKGGVPPECLTFHDARVFADEGTPYERSVSMQEIADYARNTYQEDLSCSYMFHSTAGPMSCGAHFAKVAIERDTGKVHILKYVAVHDAGRVVNPMNITGQLEGGISMGIGYALMEEQKFDEKGNCLTDSFRTYHIPNSMEMPEELVTYFLDSEEESGPYGAKSVGECAVVPAAPAIANAISNAIGVQLKKLPIRPADILAALKEREGIAGSSENGLL